MILRCIVGLQSNGIKMSGRTLKQLLTQDVTGHLSLQYLASYGGIEPGNLQLEEANSAWSELSVLIDRMDENPGIKNGHPCP
jgi:hypothetical protein